MFHVVVPCLMLLHVAQDAAARRMTNLHANASHSAISSTEVVTDSIAATWQEDTIKEWPADKLNVLLDRYSNDLAVMQQVQSTFAPTNHVKAVPAGVPPKVAMLFMVKDGLDQHALWMKFFDDAPDGTHFSIYFHQYAPQLPSAEAVREQWKNLPNMDIQTIFIPKVKTGWGQLAGVMYALLWEALRDPTNAQFVFASEGTVPLKSPSYVYRYLTSDGSAARSKLCLRLPENEFNPQASEMKKQCVYRDPLQGVALPANRALTRYEGQEQQGKGQVGRVRKHDQWVVLARQHAVDVLVNGERAMKKYLAAVLRAKQPKDADPCANGASDEVFIVTAILAESESQVEKAPYQNSVEELQLYGVDEECTTFTYWRHCWKDTALSGEHGWNASRWADYGKIISAAGQTDRSKWADPRVGLAKHLNDSPRDFGLTSARPTLKYLKAIVSTGLLFGRKFGKNETGEVDSRLFHQLPTLWGNWDRTFGPGHDLTKMHSMWPTTDVGAERVAESAVTWIPTILRGHWA